MSVLHSLQLSNVGQYDQVDGAPCETGSPCPWPRTARPSWGWQQAGETLRPTLEAGISDADWSFFVSQWERYKRSTKIMGQDAIDQLWSCASEELSRQCHDAGVSKDTTEKDLLAMLRLCSIRAQNKLVNVVEFLNSSQSGGKRSEEVFPGENPPKKKRGRPRKVRTEEQVEKPKFYVSPELAKIIGTRKREKIDRPQIMRLVWRYVHENNL